MTTSPASYDSPPQPPAQVEMRHLRPTWRSRLLACVGLPGARRLARATRYVERIRFWEDQTTRLSDPELLRVGLRLRGRARGGESLDALLPEAYAAVCVAAWRIVGLRPFDVQLVAGVVLHQAALAELATGEGKTLVAIAPVFLNALSGKGVHVTTVNDYLARRDGEWTSPVFQALGLTTGVLRSQMEDVERTGAYRADITYGTASEFAFDFLRDRLRVRGHASDRAGLLAPWLPREALIRPGDPRVQRGHAFALVDEADNIFVDEARTPLVISAASEAAPAEVCGVYRWADRLARGMADGAHYECDEKTQAPRLLPAGRQSVRWSTPPGGKDAPAMDELCERVERSLYAHLRLHRDQHYILEEDKVVIIDENTGRRMPDRSWHDGLHQAVEVKEGAAPTGDSDHAAQITYQSYFRLYRKLAGMTGTAPGARELRRVYDLRVVRIPTNRPVRRQQRPDRIFPTEQAKFAAVLNEVVRLRAQGRPVLIGTRSLDKSELLGQMFSAAGVEHEILNARHHQSEAQRVARAGQSGCVLIATNMAGRGTDIKLGAGVAAAGGLHVLGTERHSAERIDRQFAGRAGRQGDPGSCQFFLSLEDELLEALGPARRAALLRLARRREEGDWQRWVRLFRWAQRRTERKHYRERLDLLLAERRRRKVLKDLAADPYID